MHQMQSSRYLIDFSHEKSAGCWYLDNRFFWINLDKFCRKMYTIFSTVLRQQRKSDAMMSFGHSARSASYYEAGSPFWGIHNKRAKFIYEFTAINSSQFF
jgi:hypothetical protein